MASMHSSHRVGESSVSAVWPLAGVYSDRPCYEIMVFVVVVVVVAAVAAVVIVGFLLQLQLAASPFIFEPCHFTTQPAVPRR